MSPLAPRALAYLAASILFIFSLRGLSGQQTARRGNIYGVAGMALAVIATVVATWSNANSAMAPAASGTGRELTLGLLMLGSLGVGGVIGAVVAGRVPMTSMPELVAVLHSFVGAAAVLVGIGTSLESGTTDPVHKLEIFVGVFIGALTFTGSIVAFLKLRGTIGSKALLLPARHAINAALLIACIALAVPFLQQPSGLSLALLAMTGISALLGVHLVAAIGGGDMPVVVSLLNSYSGWAASASGFMLDNDVLIVTGALVGSSGAILSYVMCKAMNRSIWSVVFGGFGVVAKAGAGAAKGPVGTVTEGGIEQVAAMLLASKKVSIVPGYGMAVAQAQHVVREITTFLASRGVNATYAIHPVAGRLPGHMNVLLAEAGVSYEIVLEMEEVNPHFAETDVVLVIGANDIVNPSALEDPDSPIFGMPVLEAWKAGRVVMLKRSMAAGYAGVDNPLAYRENTLMLFGDAKSTVTKLLDALRSAAAVDQAA